MADLTDVEGRRRKFGEIRLLFKWWLAEKE